MINSKLSDRNLDLLLRQTNWGAGGIPARITASPNPDIMRAFWAGLTVYRFYAPEARLLFDNALRSYQTRHAWNIQIMSVIQAKHEMMQAPADFPFCLTPRQWHDHCQSLFGGQIDGNDYTPPSVYADLGKIVLKTVGATIFGIAAATLFPESAFAISAASALTGGAVARGVATSLSNAVVEGLLPSSNPISDAHQATLWNRYQLENQRRKLP